MKIRQLNESLEKILEDEEYPYYVTQYDVTEDGELEDAGNNIGFNSLREARKYYNSLKLSKYQVYQIEKCEDDDFILIDTQWDECLEKFW